MPFVEIDGQKIDVDAMLMDIERTECEDSLYEFLRKGWKYIDPAPFTDGWPIEAVAEHLQAVADGDIKRLIINIPPRCAKSSLTSVAFPAWVWAQPWMTDTSGAGVQFLHASYAQQLSLRDSTKCRRLIESPWYQSLWGSRFALTGDQNTKTRFDNTVGGSRLSTSVGSALTGEGGNCFPDGTLVSTPNGMIRIENISVGDPVYAFDHLRGKVVKSRVIATQPRYSNDLYEIRTTSGDRFVCTGNHPIFVAGRGYVRADSVGAGDRVIVSKRSKDSDSHDMRQLREKSRKEFVRNKKSIEAEKRGFLLFKGLLLLASFREAFKTMRNLWIKGNSQAFKVLFGCVQEACKSFKTKDSNVPALQQAIHGMERLLLPQVCGLGSFNSHEGITQLKLHDAWKIFQSVQGNVHYSERARRVPMFGVRNWESNYSREIDTACASYKREHSGQQAGELDNSMHFMPQETPSWSFGEISSVSFVGKNSVRVHDIQVERFSNFFAEDVLVHNCIIVDDPNAAQEAFSEATIETTIEWWDGALSTRLNNPKTGAFVVIQQRLSEEDLTGHILSREAGLWTHLMLPMRYEPERSYSTSIGWQDPRKEAGELLWPERFGEQEVEILERQMGPWTAAGQLQQRPEPKGGGVIKREWWQLWDQDNYPGIEYIVASLDTAYTTKTANDLSAMTVWGIFSGGEGKAQVTRTVAPNGEMMSSVTRTYTEEHPKAIMMFAWQERLELHDLVQKVADTMRKFKVDKLLIENKAAGHSVAQEIRRLFGHESFAVQLVDPKGQDKLARLYSVQHLFAEGLIYAPERAWSDMVITQCSTFPKAKHDDLVDTVSMALRHLRETGLIIRGAEWTADLDDKMRHIGAAPPPLYAV